jgi:hypothetical protein
MSETSVGNHEYIRHCGNIHKRKRLDTIWEYIRQIINDDRNNTIPWGFMKVEMNMF